MGLYPKIQAYDGGMEVVDVFRGLNRAEKISEGEWSEDLNLTTDRFPMLSARKSRGSVAQYQGTIISLIAKDDLYALIHEGNEDGKYVTSLQKGTDSTQTLCTFRTNTFPKEMISFGAYIVITGINAWYNTADGTSGEIDYHFSVGSTLVDETHALVAAPCDENGNAIEISYFYDPENTQDATVLPVYEDGDYAADSTAKVIKRFTVQDIERKWVTIPNRVRINAAGIGTGVSEGDIVTFAGLPLSGDQTVYKVLSDDAVVLDGIFLSENIEMTQAEATAAGVSAERTMPELDFVIECQNRLWGCYYGEKDGKIVNEIYATELGSFRNWRKYDGTSMASYAASVGTDGAWTGAVSYQGRPHFFKEKHVHKVYISATGAHQIVDNPLLGAQEGCAKSLCVLNGALYYMSREGVCVYDGSTPKVISEELGDILVHSAYFGGADRKLWTFLFEHYDGSYRPELYVYDTERGIWHQESIEEEGSVMHFAPLKNSLYAAFEPSGELWDLLGVGGVSGEGTVSYSCTSGLIGWQNIEQKYISRFDLRLTLPQNATMKVELEYDSSGTWIEQGTVTGGGTGSVVIPVRPRRCDHFRLRLSGTGEMRMYSWAKRLTKGSDVVL